MRSIGAVNVHWGRGDEYAGENLCAADIVGRELTLAAGATNHRCDWSTEVACR